MFEKAPTVDEWHKNNTPDKLLLWRGGQGTQCERAKIIAAMMPADCRVISSHTSKSVALPVIAFRILGDNKVDFISVLRDNFYDVCCQVVSNREMTVPLEMIYTKKSLEEMQEMRQKALDYNNRTYNEKYQDERERRFKSRLEDNNDWSWYEDWSSGKLLQKDNDFYIVCRGYYEGIPCGGEFSTRKYYEGKPTKDFSFVTGSYDNAAKVFQTAIRSAISADTKRPKLW